MARSLNYLRKEFVPAVVPSAAGPHLAPGAIRRALKMSKQALWPEVGPRCLSSASWGAVGFGLGLICGAARSGCCVAKTCPLPITYAVGFAAVMPPWPGSSLLETAVLIPLVERGAPFPGGVASLGRRSFMPHTGSI